MRGFDFKTSASKLQTNDIVNMLGYIHEYKGQQNLFIEAKADILSHLLEIAKIQSTEASNRIEGIYTKKTLILHVYVITKLLRCPMRTWMAPISVPCF